MLFHTYGFLLLFLPLAVLSYWRTRSRPALRDLMLPVLCMVFYSAAGAAALVLLLAMTAVTFGAVKSLVIGSDPRRRSLGLLLVLGNLGILMAFKVRQELGAGTAGALLPLGISFYALNLVGYGLDVYHGRTAAAASFPTFLSYSAFFPTVAAGPLVRYDDFRQQRESPPAFRSDLLEAGLRPLIVGLAKKVLVADPLGIAIEPLFADYERLGLLDAWVAVLGYAYQLYFDFSGYSEMAMGAAALMGFRIPLNFDRPYRAIHIADFWQRWHMTMSRWFRDYLFLPLSRALLRRREALDDAGDVRTACLVLTMVVIGVWHGCSWTYVAWGLYHGLLLAGHARFRSPLRARLGPSLSRALTFVAVLLGWVLLRSPSPGMALRLWGAMLGLHGWTASWALSSSLVASVSGLLVATNLSLEARLLEPSRTALRSWLLAGLLAASLLSMGRRIPFLYFQF